MKTKPLTFAKASELLYEYVQQHLVEYMKEDTELDFSVRSDCDALANAIAGDTALDISEQKTSVLDLLYARLQFGIALGVMEPDGIISHIPDFATDEEILGFLFSAEIVGMRLPQQDIH